MASWIATAMAADLKLDAVMLSSGGVGFFRYTTEVSGNAELPLTVRLDQVDDVLKSIVILDSSGTVGTIRLPGRAPLKQRFRDLPFDPEALDSAVQLLRGLRGEMVTIDGTSRLQGRLLGITAENTSLPDAGGQVVRHRIALMTRSGLRQVLLEDIEALRFADAGLQAGIDQALQDLARFRVRDTRTLLIQSQADTDTPRQLQVGYVTEAPLWKTSYRLALQPEQDRALLQGWAHLENMSGQDWDQVRLTLSSGNPVTFRQNLYQAYYVDRPEVPVEVLGRIMPDIDQGGIAAIPPAAPAVAAKPGAQSRRKLARSMAGFAREMPERADAVADSAPATDRMASPAQATISKKVAEQLLFTLPDPVTVADGYSLMAPIANRELPVKSLVLYQPDTHPVHPMDSVRLHNDGDTALPPGVVTFYADAGTYLGDARLDVLPAGDSRLLSFALNRNVRIHSNHRTERTITSGSIHDGLLHLLRREQRISEYRIRSIQKQRLWVEHPVHANWTLQPPDKGKIVERTRDRYRIELPLPADSDTVLTLVEHRPLEESLHLVSLNRQQIQAFASSNELSPALRAAFLRLAELQAVVREAERKIEQLESDIQALTQDQQRIRRNMDRLDRNSDLYRRYLNKLDRQETSLEKYNQSLKKQRSARDRAKAAYRRHIRNLDIRQT